MRSPLRPLIRLTHAKLRRKLCTLSSIHRWKMGRSGDKSMGRGLQKKRVRKSEHAGLDQLKLMGCFGRFILGKPENDSTDQQKGTGDIKH